ncbi:hypothetical protein E2562_007485, partial [Oryza meyeriana var. granulata]
QNLLLILSTIPPRKPHGTSKNHRRQLHLPRRRQCSTETQLAPELPAEAAVILTFGPVTATVTRSPFRPIRDVAGRTTAPTPSPCFQKLANRRDRVAKLWAPRSATVFPDSGRDPPHLFPLHHSPGEGLRRRPEDIRRRRDLFS